MLSLTQVPHSQMLYSLNGSLVALAVVNTEEVSISKIWFVFKCTALFVCVCVRVSECVRVCFELALSRSFYYNV